LSFEDRNKQEPTQIPSGNDKPDNRFDKPDKGNDKPDNGFEKPRKARGVEGVVE
jgi:hypothetical protein